MPRLDPLLAPETLAAHLGQPGLRVLGQPGLRVLDATVRLKRPPGGGPYVPESGHAEFLRAHVPGAGFADLIEAFADPSGAHHFTLPSPERIAEQAGVLGIDETTWVVAYAQESPMWATRLWWLLRVIGFDRVSVLDGGLPAWRAAGLPIVSGAEPAPPRGRLVPDPRPELLAGRADVERVVSGGGVCLVNALRPETFRGEGATSYSRPGRIPGSVNVAHTSLLDPETGRFRPVAELHDRFEQAGALGDEPVVAYCGGGISATTDLFALRLAGREDARLYDGSLAEWTADPALPVEVG